MLDYTTAEKITKEDADILKDPSIIPQEKEKTIISNDAYAISEFLERLLREVRRLK